MAYVVVRGGKSGDEINIYGCAMVDVKEWLVIERAREMEELQGSYGTASGDARFSDEPVLCVLEYRGNGS
jgi:hypothetical protein